MAIPFNVVKGSEASIKQCQPLQGYLWFALDTRKIYYSDGNDFISMGGNSSVFYGTLTWPEDSPPDSDQVEFDFTMNDIEGDAAPNINDLILNADGCFYRVMALEGSIIKTFKLTIAGSGSGGGGGGGGGGGVVSSVITISAPVSTKYFLENETDPSFSFDVHSTVELGNKITKITYTIGSKTYVDDTPHNFGTLTFNLKDYFSSISTNGTAFSFVVEDSYGARKTSSTYSLRKVRLLLTADSNNSDDILQATNKVLQYRLTPSGSNSVQDVVITYEIFVEGSNTPIYTTTKNVSNLSGSSAVSQDLNFEEIDALNDGLGAYQLRISGAGAAGGQTITSNVLTHSVISYGENPVLIAYLPTREVSQYDSIDISYEIAKSVLDNQKARITFEVDGELTVQEVEYNMIYTYNIYFETAGYHTVVVRDNYGHTQSFTDIYATPYDGTIQVINNGDIDLMLNLTARGRTNNEIINSRRYWDDKARNHHATLSDFVWGNVNGWLYDSDNVNMLRLSSGGSLVVDTYEPFGLNASDKEGMETGKTIELDFRVSKVIDYSQPLITCLSYDALGEILCGFNITGEVATFNTHKIKATTGTIIEDDSEEAQTYNTQIQGLTAKFAEGERIHLSWAIDKKIANQIGGKAHPLIKTYINGIISGIAEYNPTDSIAQNATLDADPALIKVNTSAATVDLYNIRVYNKTLTDEEILKNYIATLPTTEEKTTVYNSNIMLLEDGQISVNSIENGTYQIKLPYIKFTGGGQCEKNDDDGNYYLTNADGTNHLPRAKKDFRLVDHFDFVFPTDSNRNVDIVSEVADNGKVNGVVMYGQGTSSMEYPVKNLRVKFKMKKNGQKVKFQVNPDDYPVDILTLKADYMESSSSHNTGTANLVFDTLEALRLHTPGQEYWNAQNPDYKTLTAIRGYPIICFFRPDEDSDFEYIGRYNLNMDKSSEDAFGFLPVPEEEEDVAGVESSARFGWKLNDGTLSTLDPVEHPYVNSIHCYEFLNNASNLDNFISPKYRVALREGHEALDIYNSEETYYKLVNDEYVEVNEPNEEEFNNKEYYIAQTFEKQFYESTYNDKKKVVPNWLTSFESRYPEESTDVKAFFVMCNWLNSTNPDEATGESISPVTYDGVTYNVDNGDYRLAKFKAEFNNHFNKDFVLFYYVLTHVLLMIDSRAKNMMIATWDNEHWFPIFYDMDTMLGLNNYGYNKFDYNVEDTAPNVYNGQASVLWNNVRTCFSAEIADLYGRMQTAGKLTVDNLLRNYNEVQADMWNEIMYNYDATYKYITPYINGYYDGLSGKEIPPGGKNYLYAAQGSRSMHRRYWLKNRIAYFNGKYLSPQYKEDIIEMRLYTPSAGDNARLAASLAVVPPSNDFTLTPLHNQYLAVAFGGSNGQTAGPYYAPANIPKTINAPTGAQYNDTETYIYGASELKDLGDLSTQYLGNIQFRTTTKLERLVLGNKLNDYYNPNFSSLTIGTIAPELKYLDITNTELSGSLDLSSCQNIEEVYACGSGLTEVTLPSYGVLNTLRLPNTITALALDSQTKLLSSNFTIGSYDSDSETYSDAAQGILSTISIEGMPQFDSYSLLKKNYGTLLSYCFRDVNWTIDVADLDNTITSDGKYGIVAIEALLNKNATPIYKGSRSSTARALTGTITFTGVTDASIPLEVYDHYQNIYPDLTIEFDASQIKHINLYDGDGNVYWTKPIAINSTLTSSFYDNSASGAFTAPQKTSTQEYRYIFDNKWTLNGQEVDSSSTDGRPIVSGPVTTDLDFIPQFTQTTQTYTVVYHIGNETVSEQYEYGTTYANTLPKKIPYSSNNTPLSDSNQEVYPFLGYSANSANDTSNLIDFSDNSLTIASNRDFYAVFGTSKVDVHDSVNVWKDAFNYSDINYIEENSDYSSAVTTGTRQWQPNYDTSFNITGGCKVSPKAGWTYDNFVTIPNTSPSGKPVVGIEGFTENSSIERVFFEKDTVSNKNGVNLRVILSNAFRSCSNLKYFEFPENLRYIQFQAFQMASSSNVGGLNLIFNENLAGLGMMAFNQCYINNTLLDIPSKVETIDSMAFANAEFMNNCVVTIGSNLDKSVLDLAFTQYTTPDTRVIFNSSRVGTIDFYTNKYTSAADYIERYHGTVFEGLSGISGTTISVK